MTIHKAALQDSDSDTLSDYSPPTDSSTDDDSELDEHIERYSLKAMSQRERARAKKSKRMNELRQPKFTMLFTLNHIKEIMYYWGDNYKMQTSHTLCSRPKRYGALHGGQIYHLFFVGFGHPSVVAGKALVRLPMS